ncbi:MAG: sigma-70 family RNA polymerase sigma factor [Propionibacteriaceae bacterium]|jgi:RNA polymerase sigma factor (sigma-70 family)|nr:sigma-70 family RNA polymerase sigma factor [Propionibacteriaceae bacterium]
MERPRLTPAEETRLAKQIEAGLIAQGCLDGPAQRPAACTGDKPVPSAAGEPAAGGIPTVEELQALARLGAAAKERMTLANIGLVRVIAAEVARRRPIPAADLFQDGCVALEQALRRYDYRRGRFGPYAAFWIRSALRRVPAPAAAPLPDDLVDEGPVRRIEGRVTRQALGRSLAGLPKDERRVVRLRHGWDGEPASLTQVAARLDLSIAKVRRLESQGLARLRRQWLTEAA